MISISISIQRPSRPRDAAGFSEADLLALAGAAGGMLVAPWREDAVFADTEGTMQAAIDGSVGRLANLAPGADTPFTQATAGARPFLRLRNGRRMIEGNAARWMTSSLTVGTQFWHVGIWEPTGSTAMRGFGIGTVNAQENALRIVGTPPAFGWRNNANNDFSSIGSVPAWPAILTVVRESNSVLYGRVNGVQGPPIDPLNPTSNNGLALFSRSVTTLAGGFIGFFGGGVWGTGAPPANLDQIEQFFATRAGVTL